MGDTVHALLMKTDAEGNTLWSQTYGSLSCIAFAVTRTADGCYVLTGKAFIGEGEDDAFLLKTDADGNFQFMEVFGGDGYEGGFAVQETWQGGYLVSGFAEISSFVFCPMLALANFSGHVVWQIEPQFESPNPLTYPEFRFTSGWQTADGGYILSGMYNFRMIRFAPGLGVEDDEQTPAILTLGSPSPNPFGSAVQISYSLADEASVAASVYDLSGRCVAKLTEGMESSGQHSLTWDGTGMSGMPCPNGIYLITVSAGGTALSKSAILLR
jgi:hypothetical protein